MLKNRLECDDHESTYIYICKEIMNTGRWKWATKQVCMAQTPFPLIKIHAEKIPLFTPWPLLRIRLSNVFGRIDPPLLMCCRLSCSFLSYPVLFSSILCSGGNGVPLSSSQNDSWHSITRNVSNLTLLSSTTEPSIKGQWNVPSLTFPLRLIWQWH